MSRDIRFEIDYILSLTVATLGFLSIKGIKGYFDERLGYLFLGLLSIHLLLFNSYYIFENILSIDFNIFSNFESPSRYSLYLISVVFSYLFSHLITSVSHNYLISGEPFVIDLCCVRGFGLSQSEFILNIHTGLGKTLILYALPILGVLAFMAPLFAIVPSMQFFNDVQIVVSPESIEIADEFDDTKQLTVSILNNSDEKFEFNINIDLPENVILRYDDGEFDEEFNKSISVSRTNPGERLNFRLRYTGDERLRTIVPIKVEHKYTSKEYTVEADLYP